MQLRSLRERIIQTLCYEAGGLLLVTPAYCWLTGTQTAESLLLLIAVSIGTMTWAAFHNTFFDYFEASLTGRKASDRPQLWRLLHACSTEVSSIIVTTPVIMLVGGYGLRDALLIDIGLTLAYAAYAYIYHQIFDVLRPMEDAVPVSAFMQQGSMPLRDARASRGMHVMVDGYDVRLNLLYDEAYLRRVLGALPGAAVRGAVVSQVFCSGDAASGFVGHAVASHAEVSIRTFPRSGFMMVDLHCFGDTGDPHDLASMIKDAFQIRRVDVFVQERGLRMAAARVAAPVPVLREMQPRAA